MKKLVILLGSFLFTFSVMSQMYFDKTYGDENYDYGFSVIQTLDSGYIVTGRKVNISGYSDVYLIKTNNIGDTIWTRKIGGTGDEYGLSITKASDSGYIAVGFTGSFGAGGNDVYLIKFNDNGDTLWTRTFGGPEGNAGFFISQTNDNGYIITGSTHTNGAVDLDVYLIKIDVNGDTLWTKSYGGQSHDYGNSVIQTNDNGYIITGVTESFGSGLTDVYIIRTDENGDTLWTKTFGGTGDDSGKSVSKTSDGGFVIAGDIQTSVTDWSAFLNKIDINGNIIWTKIYSLLDFYFNFNSVVQTNDGGFIVAGTKSHMFTGADNVYLIKTNSYGDTLWSNNYVKTYHSWGNCVAQTFDGGFVISGTANYDVYLIKTDANGGFVKIDEKLLDTNNFIKIYPNPTSGIINLQISQDFGTIKKIEIFNNLEKIREISQNFSNVDISSFKGGLYFIVVTNINNEKIIRKVIKE
ncbi:MAG: T9SS type A sorting domain-containing protein [Bacteroidia bacterium]|nr:T9SS type A sorting domain-containing protein [Bacteroidia bacterium]